MIVFSVHPFTILAARKRFNRLSLSISSRTASAVSLRTISTSFKIMYILLEIPSTSKPCLCNIQTISLTISSFILHLPTFA